jgi:hypothetical protein
MPEPIVCLSDTLCQFLEVLYVFLASLEKVILAYERVESNSLENRCRRNWFLQIPHRS